MGVCRSIRLVVEHQRRRRLSSEGSKHSCRAPPVRSPHLQILRTRKGLTRDHLSGLAGRSGQWVKDIETGRRRTPRLEIILRWPRSSASGTCPTSLGTSPCTSTCSPAPATHACRR
ncbi:helix-turn-helix domain-containing protein [Streptomyces sp. NPDC008343]|uniref:helix-turn-helix domain-containing protein n=1 Tax=Streptomyces sp. NPDC008343 TaxID=3364828 RepID=UPI0036E0D5B9